MQVNVQCPSCNGQYQLSREMIGQKIRCPNANCRQVFEVREAPVAKPKAPKPKPPVADRRAPAFDATAADAVGRASAPVEAGPREADWTAMPPPPVRRRDAAPAAEPAPSAGAQMSPDDVLAWMHAAPTEAPTAAASGEEDYSLPAEAYDGAIESNDQVGAESDTSTTDYAHLYAQPKRRWMRWAIVGMFLVVMAGGVGFMVLKQRQFAARESILAQEADGALAENRYNKAQKDYDELYKKFEKSKDRGKYKFLSEFSGSLETVYNGTEPPVTRRRNFAAFVQNCIDDDVRKPWIEEAPRQTAIWQAYLRLLNDQATVAQKAMDAKEFDNAKQAVTDAESMIAAIETRGPADAKGTAQTVHDKLQVFVFSIEEERAYTTFVTRMKDAFKNITPVVVAEYEGLAKKSRYENRPEVVAEIQRAKEDLKKRIVFKLDERAHQSPPKNDLPLLVVGGVRTAPSAPTERVVFALARGVLYALAEANGQILWTTRVGIDVSTLPLRIPKGPNAPELVLVPAADNKGLIAREAQSGKARWLQTLEAPIRGNPVLVERRVLVPLAGDEGRVVLIETFDGSRLGYLSLGQKLAGGGAWQVGTSRVFFPAESQNIFVVDTNPKPDASGKTDPVALEAVLQTGHGSGALRGDPVVVGGADAGTTQPGPNFLILAQADGLDGMKVRAFELALPRADIGQPVELRLNGWSWFTPTCDQEKIAVATDGGTFAVFGVAQKGGEDKAIFPLVATEPVQGAGRRSGRSQVVHADDRSFWYLVNGELALSRLGYDRKDGQRLAAGWKQTLRIGTPLHAGQVSAERDVLFVVTQTATPPGCFATAVEAQSGVVRWQRPLGVSVQGATVRLGKYFYQMDQGGGLYQIDSAQVKLGPNDEWATAGSALAAPRLDLVGEPRLLLAADNQSAFILLTVRENTGTNKLLVRQLVPDQPLKEHPAVALGQDTLAGAPALVGTTLFLPLTSGKLSRLTIGTTNLVGGPDWKTAALGDKADCYVLPLQGDDLLVSNGARGLAVYSWPAAGFQFKRQAATTNAIRSAPVAVPVEKGTPRVFCADVGGQVQMLDGDSLTPILTWNVRQMQLGTEVTGGPYLIGSGMTARILVVVDRTLLVCLAADSRLPIWKHRVKGDGLAGAPHVVEQMLILSDLSGRYEALEAASGAPYGSGFPVLGTLPAAPAAPPLDGGDGRLFAPLTDGTMLLIPRDALIPKKN